MTLRTLLVSLGALLLVACGDKEEMLAPSPLPDFAPAVKIKRLWSADTGAGIDVAGARLVPAVTGQAVYVIDATGLVSARDRADGRLLWRRKTAFAFSGGPVVAYGQLFAGTREGELVALSADTGDVLWQAQLGGEVLAPPAVEGDALVVKATDGRVSLFDRADGKLRWVHDGGLPPLSLRAASRPLLLADGVVAGLASGMLVALDRATGQVVWERRVGEPSGKSELDRLVDVAGDPQLAGTRLYAATYQGRLVALDLRSGQFAWQQPLSTWQPLVAGEDDVCASDADSRVQCWRAADGVVLWRLESLLGRQLAGVAQHGAWLLAGDYQGWLHVIRRADGVIAGRVRVDRDGIAVAPVIDDGTVFVLGRGGKLAAFTLE